MRRDVGVHAASLAREVSECVKERGRLGDSKDSGACVDYLNVRNEEGHCSIFSDKYDVELWCLPKFDQGSL